MEANRDAYEIPFNNKKKKNYGNKKRFYRNTIKKRS